MKKFLFIGLAVLVVFLGCSLFNRDFYRTADDFPENGKGMLVLVLDGSAVEAHTIAPPDGTMDILSYNISGSGDHSSHPTFNVDVDVEDLEDGTVYSRNDLLPGTWTITVIAYNDVVGGTRERIGYGSINDLFVSPNSLITDTIPLGPDTGGSYTGTLTLSIFWVGDTVPNPLVVAQLTAGTPGTSNVTLPSFNFTATGGTLPAQTLTAGYYTLSVDLYKNNEAIAQNWIMGDDQSVRIVSNQNSDGSWDLRNTPGEADITISPDLNNPIEIILNVDNLFTTRVVTATLQDPPAGSFFAFAWYEDGVLKQGPTDLPETTDNDSYTVYAFTPGTSHFLSVVVTEFVAASLTSDVVTISSKTYQFTAQ